MSVEILKRERLGNGWVRFWGDVNGQKVGVRIPQSYIDTVSDAEAEIEVKQSLKEEHERLTEAGHRQRER